jgi:mono/diheme cytochrome c family protein
MMTVLALALMRAPAAAQESPSFPPEQVKAGADIYARNCSPCHGPRMQDPESAFNLKKFPRNARERFVRSVRQGKNQMPPWGDMLSGEDLDALWAYVVRGEQ